MVLLHLCYIGSLSFQMREPFRVMLAFWMIALFQSSSSINPTMRAWKNRTSHFVGCTIVDFYQMLQRPFAVYCLVSPSTRIFTFRGNLLDRKLFYVGSTLVSSQCFRKIKRSTANWLFTTSTQETTFINSVFFLFSFWMEMLTPDPLRPDVYSCGSQC